jgi:flagellin-like hook-associated protein FlgL
MRANLLSLQGTVNLLDRTQSRLSSGKKVNSAIDNPISFFASQALTSRASTIDSLKDAMGQAVQTIQSADKGIKAITALIEGAKGIAQSAQSADTTPAGFQTVQITLDTVTAGQTITIGGTLFTATAAGTPDAGEFYIGGNNTMDAQALMAAVNAAAIANYSATASGNVVTISLSTGDITAGTNVTTGASTMVAGDVAAPSTELTSLQAQYNEMRTQMSELAEDSGYKGKNLLSATAALRSMVVQFEGNTLTVNGFNATAAGLGITAADWTGTAEQIATKITADIDLLNASLTTMRQNSSSLSGNLSIITVRNEFSTNIINTLIEGSDKLTLADSNEEGANMLMLQTRQTLSTTALSLSAQAAQSVLRLFQ